MFDGIICFKLFLEIIFPETQQQCGPFNKNLHFDFKIYIATQMKLNFNYVTYLTSSNPTTSYLKLMGQTFYDSVLSGINQWITLYSPE